MKRLMLLLSCVLLLSGCTKSNIVTPEGTIAPDFNVKEGIQIDWNQVRGDLSELFTAANNYPMNEMIEFNVDDTEKTVYLMLTVKDDTTKEQAAAFATDLVKAFNDSVSVQDFSYEGSTADSYGGFFQKYSVCIQVMPASTKEEESTWLVDDIIPAGEQKAIEAK